MTNQKAIGELSALMTRQPDYAVALDKAISALEAQELSKNSTELDKENGDLQPTCNQLATDCISRQAAVDWLNNEWDGMVVSLFDGIRKLPSAQPERKKGKWIPLFDGRFTGGAYWFHCSNCERVVPDVRNGGWNFCPNCGADMRGDNDDL